MFPQAVTRDLPVDNFGVSDASWSCRPRSRNSIDWQEGPLKNGGLGGTTWAWCQNMTGDKCNNGQTAYWYSQGVSAARESLLRASEPPRPGTARPALTHSLTCPVVRVTQCFIGCPECDHVSGRRQTDLCKKGFVGQLPDDAIAVNRDVERNSEFDIYRHNPWRAPGFAPVADAW